MTKPPVTPLVAMTWILGLMLTFVVAARVCRDGIDPLAVAFAWKAATVVGTVLACTVVAGWLAERIRGPMTEEEHEDMTTW